MNCLPVHGDYLPLPDYRASNKVYRFRVSSNEAKVRIESRVQPARHHHRPKLKTHSRIQMQGTKNRRSAIVVCELE